MGTEHFWYSKKMEDWILKPGNGSRWIPSRPDKVFLNTALIDGEIKQFTEANKSSVSFSKWDDLVYLGSGTIHSVNGVLCK
jgi:hypothetical protein